MPHNHDFESRSRQSPAQSGASFSAESSNIIRYHESVKQNNSLSIVLDFADRGDLERRINAHRAAGTFIPEASDYLHRQRILLRDIRPLNVFLLKDGIVKLGDFRIARILQKEAVAQTRVGTITSIAPEVWRD